MSTLNRLVVLVLLGLPLYAHADRSTGMLRRARQSASRKASSMVKKVRARLHLPSKVSKQVKSVKRAVGKRLHLLQGYCTLATDRLQHRLPPSLAGTLDRVRLLNPGAMSSFAVTKFKEDAGFLTTFAVASPTTWHLAIPVAIGLGVNPALAIGGHELIEGPFNISVILLRQHHLRTDRSRSFWGTMKAEGKDYVKSARSSRERNRRYVRLHQRLKQRGALRQLDHQLQQQ